MSSYGTYSLRLRRERLEQLRRQQEQQRKEKLRRQTSGLLSKTSQLLDRYQDVLIHHFSRQDQQKAKQIADGARRLLQSDPDKAVQLARRAVAVAQRGLETASENSAAWSKAKKNAQEEVTMLQLALDNLLGGTNAIDSADKQLVSVVDLLAAGKTALKRENFDKAGQSAIEGHRQLQDIERSRQKDKERQETRRQIVRGLGQVLVKMGFTVKHPHLGRDSEDGKVILLGTLPSGRSARFVISLDKTVDYDFNGYHQRRCGADIKQIQNQLQQSCQLEVSNTVHDWKEAVPLEISKGALDLPNTQYRY